MPLLALTVLGLMLLGTVMGSPKPAPSQEPVAVTVPQTKPAAATPERSASLFQGTVQVIDPYPPRVTIRTDLGRLVPVAVESCALLQGLKIGDRVSLAVNAQGIVYALEATGASFSAAPDRPVTPAWQPGHCLEAAT